MGLKTACHPRIHQLAHFQFDYEFAQDRITVIFGPSGCGKSSLLRSMVGLPSPLECNQLTLGEQNLLRLPTHQRPIVLSAQKPDLLSHLSVQENLRFGFNRRKGNADYFDTVCEATGAINLIGRRTSQLSGGEIQRVAFARALATPATWHLFDEPLTHLDRESRRRITHWLKQSQRSDPRSIVYVTHDIAEAMDLADDVVILGDSGIEQIGGRHTLMHWLGNQDTGVNLLACSVISDELSEGLIALKLDQHTLWVPCTSSIPYENPSYIELSYKDVSITLDEPARTSILNILPCKVTAIESKGEATTRVQLNLGTQTLWAEITQRSCRELGLQIGLSVWAQVKGVSIRS
jgi:molybdate transport system ATP-binding protein